MQNDDEDQDFSDVINDPNFLRSVLEGLPGVDPQSDAIRHAVSELTSGKTEEQRTKKDDKKKDDSSKDAKK